MDNQQTPIEAPKSADMAPIAAAQVTEVKATRGGLALVTTALVSTCFTLLALTPIGYVIYKRTPPEVATVDLQKIVEEDQKRLLEVIGATGAAVSEDKRAVGDKMTAEFARRLSMTVEQLGQECHCVIVNKAALLAGTATDYTELVRERIKK